MLNYFVLNFLDKLYKFLHGADDSWRGICFWSHTFVMMFSVAILYCLLCPAPRRGDNKRWFCLSIRLSVCPSVAYLANNSRTQRPTMPKFGRKVPHLWCDSPTSFKIKRSKVKVTRPINTHTHRAPYLPNGKVYELQTWCTNGGQWLASDTGTTTSKVKGQGRKVTWSVWAVLAQCCTCVIRGRRRHTVSAEPGGHTSCVYNSTGKQ